MPQIQRQVPSKKLVPKISDPLSRIVDLKDVQFDGIKMLIYGHSGTGKSRFAGTFAELGPMLYLVCSGNKMNEVLSIRRRNKEEGRDIEVCDIQHPTDLNRLIEYAYKKKFATVVLDHMTELGNLILAKILKIDKLPEQLSWGLAEQSQYQQMGLQTKEYLRALIELPCNVLIIGQEREYKETKDDDGNLLLPYVSVASTPAVAGWIGPACDYVVRTFKKRKKTIVQKKLGNKVIEKEVIGKVTYYLLTGPSEIYNTKFRVPPGTDIVDEIEDPSYEKLSHLLGG